MSQEKNEKTLDTRRSEKMQYYRDVIVEHVNEFYEGNISAFARSVGISYSTMMRYLSQNGLPSKTNMRKLTQAIPALIKTLDKKTLSTVEYSECSHTSDEIGEEMMQAFIELARSTLDIMRETNRMQNERIQDMHGRFIEYDKRLTTADERYNNLSKVVSELGLELPKIYEKLAEQVRVLEEIKTSVNTVINNRPNTR